MADSTYMRKLSRNTECTRLIKEPEDKSKKGVLRASGKAMSREASITECLTFSAAVSEVE